MSFNFPDAPTVGQVFPPYQWDGEKWFLQAKPGSGYAQVYVGDDPPDDPIDNMFWWCSADGVLYFRYNDGSSTQWVIASPQPDISGMNAYIDAGDEAAMAAADAANTNANSRVLKAGDAMSGHLTPNVTGTINLGSAALRWGTVYTSDLSLNNGVGDWTIVEGSEDLFIHNHKTGRVYKFALIEVDPIMAPMPMKRVE